MRHSTRLQSLAAAFLCAQVVIGYAGWLTPKHEIFPFASWFLFLVVPDRVTDYDLELHDPARQGEVPKPFNHSAALIRASHSVASYQLIQQLGEAVQTKDEFRVERTRHQIEEQFVFSDTHYDLVEVTFRPVERRNDGRVLSKRIVRSFVSGPPQAAAAVVPAAGL